ncbi:hypothetical protein DRW03_16570 [Corallococcus sp. H22C18031201]|nr:hypothetical protein DRW03_16570 [Corallococcus sp. H22C18031201]
MRNTIINLRLELEQLREALSNPATPSQYARRLHEICRHERMLGIALLLAEADTDGFFRHLTLSAETHARLLQGARNSGQFVRFTGAGNVHPLCDALVAGQPPLARKLADLAPNQWMSEEEYEEDFVYGRFLHILLLEGTPGLEQQEALLDRMAKLDPEPEPRQRLCRALFDRDPSAFEVALVEAASEHQRHCDERAATRFSPTLEGQTERYVFIEGLALLRLAKAVGLQTEPEHILMPSLARWRD